MELPYERSAMRGDPMPAGLSMPDQAMYQGLSFLYARYREGRISREDAAAEKRSMLSEREKMLRWEGLSKHSAEFFKTVEWYASHYRKERTMGSADKLVDAVDGFLRGILGEKEGD